MSHAERCPICFGKGIVPNGFYNSTEYTWSSTSTMPEKCRSCFGRGYVEITDSITMSDASDNQFKITFHSIDMPTSLSDGDLI